MTAATPEQAALRLAVITEIREAASCESDDGDQCPKCTRHADAVLAAVAAQEPRAADALDDFYFERKQVIELRQVLAEVFTCLDAGDPALLDGDQVAEWRQRAGMEES